MRRVIRKLVRHQGDGVNVVADVNGVVAGSVGEGGSSTISVSSKSRSRVVQRSGQTRAQAAHQHGEETNEQP